MAGRSSSHSRQHSFLVPQLTGAVIGGCLSLASASLAATAPADPSHGGELARVWCASCHVVASNQQGTVAEVPPFATIAREPGFNAAKLALFLLDPHPKMPDMNLSRKEAADLAAYIATLK